MLARLDKQPKKWKGKNTMKETYTEMKKRHEQETGAFPMRFAFTESGLQEILNEWGCTREDLTTVGAGSIMRKTDVKAFINLMQQHTSEINEGMKDADFAYSAFLYEIGNHEYHINTYQGDWDVFSCFGGVEWGEEKQAQDYAGELGMEAQTLDAFYRARKEHYRLCDENDWW